ncbi:S9 family peptidase [Bacteroidales bacterium OttesenSCG-928-M11]|nr:S9 family peptidase [Bacteroidales bacterium OttesenSCG-928-M11]
MKKLFLPILILTIMLSSCAEKKESEGSVIGKPTITVQDGILTAEILHQFGQVSGGVVSPDGKTILYGVTYTDIAQNKRNRELFTVNIDGTNKKQITNSAKGESGEKWIKNGEKIAFIYEGQLWEMNVDGSNRIQISNLESSIEGFKFSPDETKLLFISQVKSFVPSSETYPDLDKSTGKVIDDLMYKHWDEWVTTIPHPFVADYDGKGLSNIVDLMDGEPFEGPLKPFGGISDLDWEPTGKAIAYTSKKMKGKEYALSTNSDIYIYSLESKETTNLTEGMMGYDAHPSYSPDKKTIAWLSMERDGYESDRNRLFITGNSFADKDQNTNDAFLERKELTKGWDYNVDDYCWSADGSKIYIVSNVLGTSQLFVIADLYTEPKIEQLTKGQWDYTSVSLADGCLVGMRRSMSCPPEVYSVNLETKEQTNLSEENTDILDQLTMGNVEGRWIKTTTNEDMLTWVVYPPHFDPKKKYPAILYCQGGPQNTVSQFWSTRWNLQMMAANGYIVVAPNRHGVPGFGQAWNEQISGDYGGQNMRDYLSAIDAVAAESFVDETRLGCTGASYGGFSVYWIAGNHNKRFKAFFAHAGMFNMEAKYLETEEIFFPNWDLGGPFWDKSNKIAQNSFANSPHHFVQNWDTPIMISHGELDYRVLATQGMMAFNAAQLMNIPSRLLIYPDENHWILQPQNGILFQREFFRWFDQWLK